jgi:multisubunit Na+/H+ antiporter MnhG subunit
MDWYSIVLAVHSWIRWAVLLAAIVAIGRAAARSGRPWTPTDERAGRLFGISLDVQFLLGILLYFVLSPFTRQAMGDFALAMRTSSLRFWAVEHILGMVIAVALAHIGRARIAKAATDQKRHRIALVFYTLALLAILASIPWPGTPNGRPLLRW